MFTNYLAVITFYPTVVSVYYRYFRRKKPSRCRAQTKRRCKTFVRKVADLLDDGGDSDDDRGSSESGSDPNRIRKHVVKHGEESCRDLPSDKVLPVFDDVVSSAPDDRPCTPKSVISTAVIDVKTSESREKEVAPVSSMEEKSSQAQLGAIETFFRDSYFAFIRRWKLPILLISLLFLAFMLSKALELQPDPDSPNIFRPGTNLEEYTPNLVDYFARGASQRSISVNLVFGINEDNPLDRRGTIDTNASDYGTVHFDENFNLAKGAPCLVQLCDILEVKDELMEIGGEPSFPISCWTKAMRDYVEENPSLFGTNGWRSMTGPSANVSAFDQALHYWLGDPDVFNEWRSKIRSELVPGREQPVVRFTMISFKLMADFQMDYRKGLELSARWEDWYEKRMSEGVCAEVQEFLPGFVESGAFHYYRLSEVMQNEAFLGIGISLAVAAVVLTVATHNIVIGIVSTLCIGAIVVCVVAFTVLQGWKLGILESINLVMVPGLSVDYVAHLAEAYVRSVHKTRAGRTRDMLTQVGVSVISGALSTLGATFFLFFPQISFFAKFGQFIFATILFSLFFSLTLFSCLLITPLGPQHNTGDLRVLLKKSFWQCKRFIKR